MTERFAIALTLWGEGRGESVSGRIAIACVIRNRRRLGRWGQSFESVCLARKQFSCWNVGDPNAALLATLARQLEAGQGATDPVLRESLWIADGLLTDAIVSNVAGATHYHATTMAAPPAWTKGSSLVAEIGRHRFFSNVN